MRVYAAETYAESKPSNEFRAARQFHALQRKRCAPTDTLDRTYRTHRTH